MIAVAVDKWDNGAGVGVCSSQAGSGTARMVETVLIGTAKSSNICCH